MDLFVTTDSEGVYMGMNETPSGERIHIGFFGRRNAGKSSLVNAVTGQDLSIVSEVRGTTTDPVSKSMELLPLGPVVIIDTPGIDDEGELGIKRVGKSRQVLNKTDLAILVVDATTGTDSWETEMIRLFEKKEIPYLVVYNKADLLPDPAPSDRKTSRNASQAGVPTGIATGDSPASDPAVSGSGHSYMVYVSAKTGFGIHDLKERMARLVTPDGSGKRLVADLVHPLDVIILVVPIDKAAPKGRLILPQQQVIRDLLDSGAMPIVCRESELAAALDSLKKKPSLVITDSQVFPLVDRMTPKEIRLTSFSILFARYKGNLTQAVHGARALNTIQDGDKILMSKYAGRTYKKYALLAGFTEIGETLEETVQREVMEEVGLKVKNIRYYKSQPWSFTDTLLMGFYCDLDGEAAITLDREELAMAEWFQRDEIPVEPERDSITNEMIIRFKNGEV